MVRNQKFSHCFLHWRNMKFNCLCLGFVLFLSNNSVNQQTYMYLCWELKNSVPLNQVIYTLQLSLQPMHTVTVRGHTTNLSIQTMLSKKGVIPAKGSIIISERATHIFQDFCNRTSGWLLKIVSKNRRVICGFLQAMIHTQIAIEQQKCSYQESWRRYSNKNKLSKLRHRRMVQ